MTDRNGHKELKWLRYKELPALKMESVNQICILAEATECQLYSNAFREGINLPFPVICFLASYLNKITDHLCTSIFDRREGTNKHFETTLPYILNQAVRAKFFYFSRHALGKGMNLSFPLPAMSK